MRIVPIKRIKVEFVVPNSIEVRLGDLEEFLHNHTNEVKVEDLQEISYLSEVPSEISEESPGSTPSTRQYNKRGRSFIHSQASEASSGSSTYRGYHGPCDQNSAVSDISDLSKHSRLPTSVLKQTNERIVSW